ncbi:MAG TPA: DMT family transporter [Longilinea sp.]|nr:DMT family transporter [Longilinea sp.]
MPIFAIALLLTSAVIHTFWNLLFKQSVEKYAAMGWQVIVSSVLGMLALCFTGLPPRSVWLIAVISVIFEAIYYVLLSFAYNYQDFSLVYPVARGAAPALVATWTALFLHEIPSTGGFIGIALIICGMVIIGSAGLYQPGAGLRPQRTGTGKAKASNPQFKGVAIALSLAVFISIYTLIDGYAVKQVPSLPYGLTIFALVPFLTTPVLVKRYGWKDMLDVWRVQPIRLLLIGSLCLLAYMLVLFAYSLAPVNYSEAIREVSVVLAAFAGWQFLGEKLGKVRILGAVVIFAGIVMIAVLG